MIHNSILIIHIRVNSFYNDLTQRTLHLVDCFLTVLRPYDQFCHHGIIIWRNRITTVYCRIDADSLSSRKIHIRDRSRRRAESFLRILCIDPALDRMSGQFNVFLCIGQLLSGCDTDLFLYKIYTGYPFRYRMLHLDPGIHFHEIKVPGFF